MKKAEIHQVFIYLMVIIVVGTLMLVGYKAIQSLFPKVCDVQEADFKTQLRNSLQRNSYSGASETKAFRVPCGYEKICFLNSELPGDFDYNDITFSQIKLEAEQKTGRQIFMVKGSIVVDINFVVDGLEVDNDFFCIDSRGSNFNLKMDGISRGKVLVSDPFSS